MSRNSIVLIIAALVIVGGVLYVANKKSAGQNKTYILKTVTDAKLGTFLVSTNGLTLYTFANDKPGVSNCTGKCLSSWPPYVASGEAPFAVDTPVVGVTSVIVRADGIPQMAYNGMPLYFWKNDLKPGDTLGQNFNKVWFVVKP